MRNPCCPPLGKYWVATATHTAYCANGTGQSTVTRQGTSKLSMEHATQLAHQNAKTAAESALVCVYTSTQCINPTCGTDMEYPPVCATYESTISQEDADKVAFEQAQQLVENYCTIAAISAPFSSVTGGVGVVSFTLIAVDGAVGYEFQIDSGAWVDIGASTSASGISVSAGAHTLQLRGYDSAGRGGPSSTFGFTTT